MKKRGFFKFFLVGCAAVALFLAAILGFLFWGVMKSDTGSGSGGGDVTSEPLAGKKKEEPPDGIHSPEGYAPMTIVKSIRSESLEFKKADQLPLCQFWLAKAVLDVAGTRKWDGGKDTKLPVKSTDIDLAYLEKCGDQEKARSAGLAMPDELEELYVGAGAESQIRDLVWQARLEFIPYASSTGVNSSYIEELEQNGFPKDEDRLSYKATTSQTAGPNFSVGFRDEESGTVEDYSKRMMKLNGHALYVMACDMEKSGVIDSTRYADRLDYYREYRDMAVRYTTYHEMVHVMQSEINSLNVENAKDKTLKTAWVRAGRNILKIDDRYFRKWGSSEMDGFSQFYNLTVAQESQAEGVAFKMLVEAYDMSEAQKKLFWEFRFGRLESGRKNLNAVLDLLESSWPEFNPEDLGSKIGDDVFAELPGTEEDNKIKRYGVRIARWLETIAYHQGVLNPMTAAETDMFWEYLKPTPLLFAQP